MRAEASTLPVTGPAARRSRWQTSAWSALVGALSAAAWLVWLSWADDQPDLATWQVAGVLVTLLSAVLVGGPHVGHVRTWLLATAPFAALGAYSLIGSDPLGVIGAVVWIFLSAPVVATLMGLVWVARRAAEACRGGVNWSRLDK